MLNNNTDSTKRVDLHTVLVERGLSWEKALEIYKKANQNNDESIDVLSTYSEGFYISTQVNLKFKLDIP